MKKKIFVASRSLSIGGVEKALLALINSLNPDKYQIDLYLLNKDGELLKFVNDNIHINYLSDSLTWILLPKHHVLKSIKQLLLQPKHLYSFIRNLCCGVLNRRMAIARQKMWRDNIDAIPHIIGQYDAALDFSGTLRYFVLANVDAKYKYTWVHSDYRVFQYDKQIDYDLLKDYTKIFCVSTTCKEIFDSEFPTLQCKSEVLLNTIDKKYITSQIKSGESFNDNFQGKRLLDITRLDPNKGLDIAVRVCSALKKQHLSFRWYILGSDPLGYKTELQSLIKKYDVEDCFILLGFTTNPYPYMNDADLIVHFSRFEGRSVAIDEALFLNKTILLTNYPTAKDQITHGINGFICDFNEEELCKMLKRLIENHN